MSAPGLPAPARRKPPFLRYPSGDRIWLHQGVLGFVEPDELLTNAEATRRIGISSVNATTRWLMEGRLEGQRIGERWLVSARSVQELLDAAVEDVRRLQAEHIRVERLIAEDDIDIDPCDPEVRKMLGLLGAPKEGNSFIHHRPLP